MIVQFTIEGSNSRHTFKMSAKDGKYFDNGTEITKERYMTALEYFNANRSKK